MEPRLVEPETLELGVFGRAHGVRGAVSFWPHNAASDALRIVKRGVRADAAGARVPVTLQSARPAGKGWVVTLAGVSRREDAEALLGQTLFIDPALLPPIEDSDEFYYHEVMGAEVVTSAGVLVGKVTDVFETSTDVLTVQAGDRELFVPVVGAYVVHIDRAARRVVVVDDVVELLSLADD